MEVAPDVMMMTEPYVGDFRYRIGDVVEVFQIHCYTVCAIFTILCAYSLFLAPHVSTTTRVVDSKYCSAQLEYNLHVTHSCSPSAMSLSPSHACVS